MATHDSKEARERLLTGVLRFQKKVYPQQRAKYQELVRSGQKPHTLFITCADSRVDPALITQSEPGELFVSRNIGNLAPAYGEVLDGVSAIVEYAVAALQVSHIVVCGHTDCGAMIGLLHPEKVTRLPSVKSWLGNAEAALSTARQRSTASDEHSTLENLIEENVLLQLHHLRTHPSVAGCLAIGGLALSGWVFDIAHGIVRAYDEEQRRFLPVTAGRPITSRATN